MGTKGTKAIFGYFHGKESDTYTFYRIPKVLFTNSYFKELSCEAKVLYGLMLDRMSLSAKNGWFDEENRVYIIFKLDDIQESIGCGRKKAVAILDELDSKNGIGLIERKRIGLSKPNVIYVKDFVLEEYPDDEEDGGDIRDKGQEEKCPDGNFLKCQKETSGSVERELQEVSKRHSNYNNYNNTKGSKNKSNLSISSTEVKPETAMDRIDKIDEVDVRNAYRDVIRENVSYQALSCNIGDRFADELIEIMVDTVCTAKPYIAVNGEKVPSELVKNKLLKLNMFHLEYVYTAMQECGSKIRNIRQYLLTALYNASTTREHYYRAKVNYDMREEDGYAYPVT